MSKRIMLALCVFASPLFAQAKPAPSAVVDARALFKQASANIIESAQDVPETKYGYKPIATVRSFAELFGHVAGSEAMFCAMALGEKPPAEDAIEKGAKTKPAIIEALKASAASCTRAYAQSDAALGGMIDVFGTQRTRLYALMMNVGHDNEHYGNIVTYLRMNGMVPPTSKPAPAK